jgi:AcrR family transcriptional regulator
MATPRLRADAQRSRDAIVAAYAELAAERGADVPMYEVARRAGVGQGTLYRHFPDRTVLLAALFEGAIDALEAKAAAGQDRPGLLFELLDEATMGQAIFHGLSTALISAEGSGVELRHLAERNLRLFEAPLARAIDAGLVRGELTARDMVAIMSMMEGMLIGLVSVAEREEAVARGMNIALAGIRLP